MGISSSRRDGSSVAPISCLPPSAMDVYIDDMAGFPYGVAGQDQVEHYMPPQFPLVPYLTSSRIALCRQSWAVLHAASTPTMKKHGRPGIVLVYEEFFYRLIERDMTMTRVFPTAKKRGEVLIRAIQFILSSNADTPQDIANVATRCRYLGHRHRSFPNIRPHHFATYTLTCVEVIMFWLGDLATPEVGAAWSNTVGFILKHLLEPYLHDATDPYECHQNTSIPAVREVIEARLEADCETTSASTHTKSTPDVRKTSAWGAVRSSAVAKPAPKITGIAVTSLILNEARKARERSCSPLNIP
ncbi:hypothetical protein H310_01580 [Aphanomyces invadans]|uniref:Globin domain-containing protein n=1 Tax=Aphanomyces invadans TaxID=157072 RepID=A0A024UT61_9STRA|nr:hypothetical protein H310_01580 [Aphanomyces invadans]ETW09145.1 hypothetical protein H310_01580 [Aphanomyces invadans]|eukprot:XP_008862950.1 hypothetical protein H310_01580 [Aphanomyces invadans]